VLQGVTLKDENTIKKLEKIQESNLILIIFVVSFVLYLLTKSVLIAFIAGASLISWFMLDIYISVLKEGWKKELIELGKAAAAALIIFGALTLLLGSPVPISGVVSCSLLPSYERGDFVVVKGIKAAEINAPTVEISKEEFQIITQEKIGCGNGTKGVISYNCQANCPRISSSTKQMVGYSPECVRSITINSIFGNRTIYENLSNDVIVYASHINGKYTGMDIVHRAFLKLKVKEDNTSANSSKEEYYILTKGDNNNYMDISYFDIVREEDLKGKVILRIPVLGYIKLLISGPQYYGEPEGCDTILLH